LHPLRRQIRNFYARVVRGVDTAEEPTGTYVRRAWFLYEALTGKLLDADDVAPTGYINKLDPKLHVTGPVRRVRRQRVNNNPSETIHTVH
jgi:hypothetical protein